MLKTFLMFGVAGAALLGTCADAKEFQYTGSEQTYYVQTTGLYQLTAAGGAGSSSGSGFYGPTAGGRGAVVQGQVELGAGSILDIFVGGAGQSCCYEGGSGGGGTFVFLENSGSSALTADTALIVAGGGGGASVFADGADSTAMGGNGQGGNGGYILIGGAGGAGVRSGGQSMQYAAGGSSPSAGGHGGAGYLGGHGGFGGGGGGGTYGAGGGGGFSGGQGGLAGAIGGGAGSSYLRDDFVASSRGLNDRGANGQFDLTLKSVVSAAPEPATWLEMVMGVGLAGLAMRRRGTQSRFRLV